MDPTNVYEYLSASIDRALIVQFRDGDKYPIGKLDLCKSLDLGDEPIMVLFSDCLCRSKAREFARGSKKSNDNGLVWSSGPKVEPVGIVYGVEDIASIRDLDQNYNVYEAAT